MVYYPISLNIDSRNCVVVGGGVVAERKIDSLLEAGAVVTVIAPDLTARLSDLARSGRINHLNRPYESGDLDSAFLVISATPDVEVNDAVAGEARERQILVNVVDDPERCGFIAPSVVRKGDLTGAISTSGKVPAFAARLKKFLEWVIGEEHALFLDWAGSIRNRLLESDVDPVSRTKRWYRLVDSDVFDLLREGDETGAKQRFADHLGVDFDSQTPQDEMVESK
ncbi:MAG: bifunctional precorrin-2 dehydrogenase/sirohydrochlorin ferrochelatase [Candidatus Latescibacteria bacterium]|nr:bifunctional precorrin-2 dehydrogenase/sirohydrochlorin ferrochelatase [Candidatus Latescibacterota bacterium]